MATGKRDERRDDRGRKPMPCEPLPDWLEVGSGEYPVFTRPRDGGRPTLRWFETEAEACEYYRQYLRDEFGLEVKPGAS